MRLTPLIEPPAPELAAHQWARRIETLQSGEMEIGIASKVHGLKNMRQGAGTRGAINALMAEVLDGHIRFHVVDPDQNPGSEKARATQELIDVIRAYLR
jgi:hypothetical protein